MTAYELYHYKKATGNQASAECLGGLWGDRAKSEYKVRFATTTQLIEKRTNGYVIGPDPITHLLHLAWAGLDVSDANYLGSFHSHPWTAKEVAKYRKAGNTDDIFWSPSPEDQPGVDLFTAIKSLTITGYYTSEVGMREEMGDDGNMFFLAFKGCTHPQHQG